ncbi:MAG: hypothetical protein OEL20_02715 [Sulfuritalea sp.]|nr:hypothetical protein [Sulfuritalea sp.]
METSVSSKTSLLLDLASVAIALMAVVAPAPVAAEILLQTNKGVWVNGAQFAYGFQAPQAGMSSIIVVPDGRGNNAFLAQRAWAWSAYKRSDSATGLLLVDPGGVGTLSATSPRQANARVHAARANAYRLEYFKK